MLTEERRSIAAKFISCAAQGFRAEKLIACVKGDHPRATPKDLVRAAFMAVTRREADEGTVHAIYEVAISLRQAINLCG